MIAPDDKTARLTDENRHLRERLRLLPDRGSVGRTEIEAALRESEARLSSILDAMPDCVKIFDESGRLLQINPRGLELLEAPDLESITRPGVIIVPPEYLPRCLDVHARVMAGETVTWTYEIISLRGRRRPPAKKFIERPRARHRCLQQGHRECDWWLH